MFSCETICPIHLRKLKRHLTLPYVSPFWQSFLKSLTITSSSFLQAFSFNVEVLLFDIKTSNFPSEDDQSGCKSKNTLASIFSLSQKKKLVKIFILMIREAQNYHLYIQCMFVNAAAEFMN